MGLRRLGVVARGLVVTGDEVLLAHLKGEPNTFLPGGSVEYGEFAEAALRREFMEELGVECRVSDFIGVLEYMFTDRHGRDHHGVELVFEVDGVPLDVESREPDVEFMWCPLDQLRENLLLPEPMPGIIESWLDHRKPVHVCQKQSKMY